MNYTTARIFSKSIIFTNPISEIWGHQPIPAPIPSIKEISFVHPSDEIKKHVYLKLNLNKQYFLFNNKKNYKQINNYNSIGKIIIINK